MKPNPKKLLEDNNYKIIQFCEQDNELFHSAELRFEADIFDCIRAHQIMNNNGIKVYRCGLDLNIIDGVLEKPCGSITFFRNDFFCI